MSKKQKSAGSCYIFRYTALLLFCLLATESLINIEADDGTQTRDLMITNQLLYQLSYIGVIYRFVPANKNPTKILKTLQVSKINFFVKR
jgi:hypothetical protein